MTNGITEMLNGGLVLAGSILGYVLAGRNESRRDARALTREGEARKELAREKREISKHQFQLDTMLALQDALRLLVRVTGLILVHDIKSLKNTRNYAPIDTNLIDESFNARIDFVRLLNRVTNDELRASLNILNERTTRMSLTNPLLMPNDVDEEIAKFWSNQIELSELGTSASDKLGIKLRELLDGVQLFETH